MSSPSQPQVQDGRRLTARAFFGDTDDEVTDSGIVGVLATWLAEISAEACVRPPTPEEEPPSEATG